MKLKTANRMLSQAPCIIERDELKAILLDDIVVIQDPLEFETSLDDLHLKISSNRTVIKGSSGKVSRRFPHLNLDVNLPDKGKLNSIISEKYHLATCLLPRQSEISEKVLQVPPDETCILMIVDGLSYSDACSYFDCEPIIANGPTLTKNGIMRIVGKPTIAERMYARGTTRLYGYSYWSREENEDITGQAFAPISPDDLYRYENFDEVIKDLKQKEINRSYIQIFVTGLDNLCHNFRDFPPIDAVLKELKKKLDSLEEICAKKNIRSTIFVTSDHGILWKGNNDFEVLQDTSLKEGGPRWTKGKIAREYTINHEGPDTGITSMKYPYVTRNLKRNEWGTHGGVSYEESVIPWITRVVC